MVITLFPALPYLFISTTFLGLFQQAADDCETSSMKIAGSETRRKIKQVREETTVRCLLPRLLRGPEENEGAPSFT